MPWVLFVATRCSIKGYTVLQEPLLFAICARVLWSEIANRIFKGMKVYFVTESAFGGAVHCRAGVPQRRHKWS